MFSINFAKNTPRTKKYAIIYSINNWEEGVREIYNSATYVKRKIIRRFEKLYEREEYSKEKCYSNGKSSNLASRKR